MSQNDTPEMKPTFFFADSILSTDDICDKLAAESHERLCELDKIFGLKKPRVKPTVNPNMGKSGVVVVTSEGVKTFYIDHDVFKALVVKKENTNQDALKALVVEKENEVKSPNGS